MARNWKAGEMDAAAKLARKELDRHFHIWGIEDMIRGWLRWFRAAGHKRLGRILLDLAAEKGLAPEQLDDGPE